MSALRRRALGQDSDTGPSRTPSPAPVDGNAATGNVSVPIDKLNKLNQHVKKTKTSKRRNAWIFGLGGLFGILVALFFAQNRDVVDLEFVKHMNLDSIMDVLPAGLVKDAQELQVSIRFPMSASR